MDFAERTKWTKALLACQTIRDRKMRDIVVDELPQHICVSIRRFEVDNVDIMNILKRILEFDDGLTQFIKIVRVYEGDSRHMQAVNQLYEQIYPATPITEYTDPPQETSYYPAISLHPILDRKEPVDIFRQLLDPDHICRFMRLSGAAKMGKSHLLTKVFPALAQQAGARIAIMDMRGSQTAIDWLYGICNQLGILHFPKFDKAYQERLLRPTLLGQNIQAISSEIDAQGRQQEDTLRMMPHFTRILVDDLRQLNDRPIVLLCDAVDDAEEDIQAWLMESLLAQLQPLHHLHIVVGGRTLPQAFGSYTTICQNYELGSVKDDSAYIDYCQALEIQLEANTICEFAKVFDYAPGRFVETVHTYYLPEGHPYV